VGRQDALKRLWKWLKRLLLAFLVLGVVLGALIYSIPLPARLRADVSVEVTYRDGEVAYVFLSSDDKWRLPVDRVDPELVRALVALEDKRFWSHSGVDARALLRAAWTDVIHARRVSGGSTLTMQLARLLEPRPRTIPSKVIEMFRALQLEVRLPKRRILDMYLQLAPYGENLEGIESAAMAYFGHGAAHLTQVEIATLLAVPQGPARFAPSAANAARLRARRNAILAKLGWPPTDEPVPGELRPFPRGAAHAAVWLRGQTRAPRVIRTTLDEGTQTTAEKTLALAGPELERRGIHDGAIVVVDHATREVRALVARGSEIPMFDKPRSPGSTLKPFLYAMAVDRGVALPGFLVADVPAAYGVWRPRNFDSDWNGLVTLEQALSRSLNLPFVNLLAQVGVEDFLGELGHMGVTSPARDPGHYGLSLIVGGIEVTPLELAGLYATLAEEGRYQPLRIVRDGVSPPPSAVFAPGAAYLTRAALSLRERPDFPARRRMTGAPPEIHWKTGTSFGFRDAWAVGSGPELTAAVWLGNVDNRPSAELIGAEAAGPILFDTLEALADRAHIPMPQAPPSDLTWVEVCSYSGHLAGAACPHKTKVLAPQSAVPTSPCPYHVQYDVDVATGEAVTPVCRKGRTTEPRTFVVLPSGVARWLADANREVPPAPAFAPGCEPPRAARGPAIVSPPSGQVVMLLPGVPATRQEIAFQAETPSPVVTWFVDGELVGTAASSERLFWTPSPGRHDVVVADETGLKDRRTLEVRASR
jgi:penicillin-binding protein 1C